MEWQALARDGGRTPCAGASLLCLALRGWWQCPWHRARAPPLTSGRRTSWLAQPRPSAVFTAWPWDFSVEGKRLELERTLLIPGLMAAASQVRKLGSRQYLCENEKQVLLPLGDPARVQALAVQSHTAALINPVYVILASINWMPGMFCDLFWNLTTLQERCYFAHFNCGGKGSEACSIGPASKCLSKRASIWI